MQRSSDTARSSPAEGKRPAGTSPRSRLRMSPSSLAAALLLLVAVLGPVSAAAAAAAAPGYAGHGVGGADGRCLLLSPRRRRRTRPVGRSAAGSASAEPGPAPAAPPASPWCSTAAAAAGCAPSSWASCAPSATPATTTRGSSATSAPPPTAGSASAPVSGDRHRGTGTGVPAAGAEPDPLCLLSPQLGTAPRVSSAAWCTGAGSPSRAAASTSAPAWTGRWAACPSAAWTCACPAPTAPSRGE